MHKSLFFITFIFTIGFLSAQNTSPEFALNASGGVYDFIIDNQTLYAATDAGSVDIFDIKTQKLTSKISLPKITDYSGEKINPKIYAIDKISEMLLLTSEGEGGYRDVFLYKNKTLSKLKSAQDDKLMVRRAAFVDKSNILIGLMSNELVFMDINTRKHYYRIQLDASVFSDFAQGTCRELAVCCDESGKLRWVNIRTGKIFKTFQGQNLDNVYKTDYANLTFISAGQDRKVGVYRFNSDSYSIEADFLIYAVGLSADASRGAFSANAENEIRVFDTKNRQIITTLSGQKSTLTKIFFIDNQTLVTSSEDKEILVWKI